MKINPFCLEKKLLAAVLTQYPELQHIPTEVLEPKNSTWITKVCTTPGSTEEMEQLTHHPKGDHAIRTFPMHLNCLHRFFALNCSF
jgi:hypothetical protein